MEGRRRHSYRNANDNVLGGATIWKQAKNMADKNKEIFGFIPSPAFRDSYEQGELFVGRKGFCRWHQRLDGQTTIYEIYVKPQYRRQGVATSFIRKLGEPILAKCPAKSTANRFWQKLNFMLRGVERGKKRKLLVWVLD